MLSIKNLTKIYKTKGGSDTKALDNVTIDFPETGMIFLLGKSGSGKSTLLNLIGGLDFPTSGEIILKGRSSKDFSQSDFDSYRNTYIGFVFQEYNILNEFNVEQNIALAIELQGKKVTKEAVNNILEQVDLSGYAKRKPNTLSGGQKQRIAIARALIKEPNIIMADEPTGALDSKTGEQVFETLKKLSQSKLVIVVSHDRDFAERFGDRIIELKDGQIIVDQTKHIVESKTISDNVTIINKNAIKINDAKKLTKQEFEKLYDSIVDTDGEVFISSGENAIKSMKASRISNEGTSDEFKETEGVALKEYNGQDTTFIKSRMPLSKSTKMGLSSLKTKPIRLVFTMFLSVVSFTMFGVSSALMLYNSSHTLSEALAKTDYQAEKMSKHALGKYQYQRIDRFGNVEEESSWKDQRRVYYDPEDINKLNNNSHNLVYIPVGCSRYLQFEQLLFANEAEERFYQRMEIKYLSDANKETFDKLNYPLIGNYPANDKEILLPICFAEMILDTRNCTKTTPQELVGQEYKFNTHGNDKTLTISGFFDNGKIAYPYTELKNNQTELNVQEIMETYAKYQEYLENSFSLVAFVTPNFFDANIDSDMTRYYFEAYQRMGMEYSVYEVNDNIEQEYYTEVYTDDILKRNKNSFSLFDLDGNPIDINTFVLKDDEAFLSFYDYKNKAFDTYGSFVNYLNDCCREYLATGGTWIRYAPNLANFFSENTDFINNLSYDSFACLKDVEELYNTFKTEFDKAYKIARFAPDVLYKTGFDSLADEEKELLQKAANCYYLSESEVNQVYQLLVDNYDKEDFQKNYFYTIYLSEAASVNEDDFYSGSKLDDLWNKNPINYTDEDIAYITDYLESNYQNGFRNRYGDWKSYLNGYTFASYSPVNEKIFQPNKDIGYNYSSYKGNKGAVKAVGYYLVYGETYGNGIFTKKFIDSQTIPQYGTTYYSYFETKYEKPSDAKYDYAMVKTEYTQSQIDAMLKGDSVIKYQMNSPTYERVSMLAEIINTMKQVFFWIGVVFGAFAALMLLNFISVSIANKKKDIGILRAIGARKIDVFKIFFSEALFIGVVCSLLAIIGTFVSEFFIDRYFVDEVGISVLQFSLATVGLIFAIALAITFIATIIPVVHSSRKPPVESIRAL